MHTVKFQVDDTVVTTQKVRNGEQPTTPIAPTKENYAFDGWMLNDAEITVMEQTITDDVTYVAKFTKLHTVTLRADNAVFQTYQVRDGAKLTALETTPAAVDKDDLTYQFAGWTSDGTNPVDITAVAITADTTWHALYRCSDWVASTVTLPSNMVYSFAPTNIWQLDGKTHYSSFQDQYVWEDGGWVADSPSNPPAGSMVWFHNQAVYYAYGNRHFQLVNNVWIQQSWSMSLSANDIWHDNSGTAYHSNGSSQMQLKGNAWVDKDWGTNAPNSGRKVWQAGTVMYYSDGDTQWQLVNGAWVEKDWGAKMPSDGSKIWQSGQHVYYSDGTTQMELVDGVWVDKNWGDVNDFNRASIWQLEQDLYLNTADGNFLLVDTGVYCPGFPVVDPDPDATAE